MTRKYGSNLTLLGKIFQAYLGSGLTMLLWFIAGFASTALAQNAP